MKQLLFGFLIACLFSFNAQAEQVQRGDYVIWYNVVNTTLLPDTMAKKLDIHQQKNRALVSVTLQKPQDNDSVHAVAAEVSGHAKTLMGEITELDFRRIDEASTTYNIAILPLKENQQTLNFTLKIKDTKTGKRFSEKFLIDLQRPR